MALLLQFCPVRQLVRMVPIAQLLGTLPPPLRRMEQMISSPKIPL
jgi:hypothetical protein